ncbi:MAG: DNA polymerase III subunit delta [Oscillospiraceae bacterium]|jgi:DNA polymerase-3 subunit delta|nr:DNA polymerase III subunit delta [Oscillospiraceae bacterium]
MIILNTVEMYVMDKNAAAARQSVETLRQDISEGKPRRLYVLHGEERYLRDRMLESLRALLKGGSADFDHRRLAWKKATVEGIRAAVDTPPAFSEYAIIEARDFDFSGAGESDRLSLCRLFADLPEYACLVFVFDTLEYKPDGRTALGKALKKYACVVEFGLQDEAKLVKWVAAHFKRLGKSISAADAKHLIGMTDGYMAGLCNDIEILASYTAGSAVTSDDIDAVVTPTTEAFTYNLTDALARGDYDSAAVVLDTLLRMREAPHKLIYSISLKMRQLLAARVCLENRQNAAQLAKMCDIRFQFQANSLMSSARSITLDECRDAVSFCAQAAYAMNSGGGEEELIKLLPRLAISRQTRASAV